MKALTADKSLRTVTCVATVLWTYSQNNINTNAISDGKVNTSDVTNAAGMYLQMK